jgi:hypothetical protein
MEHTKTIEIDVVTQLTEREFVRFLDKTGVKYDCIPRLVAFDGPGGGNPQVQFTGTEANLRTLLDEWYFAGEDDQGQIDEIMSDSV